MDKNHKKVYNIKISFASTTVELRATKWEVRNKRTWEKDTAIVYKTVPLELEALF